MPVEEINIGDKKIILVGTAHISNQSVKTVEETFLKYQPDTIAVELCRQRYEALKQGSKWDDQEITKIISSDKIYLFLLQIMLGNFQRRIGEEIGVKPGAEMMAAVELAEKNNKKIVLADREVKVTLKRAMDQMSLKEKARLLYGFFEGFFEDEKINEELIEKLKEKDVLTELMEELALKTPSIKKVLVDERDTHIAHSIYAADSKVIMAVVGAGHMKGIVENLRHLGEDNIIISYTHSVEGQDIKGISGKKIKLIGYGVPLIFAAILAIGFIQHGSQMTFDMMVKWFLINGTLAALGTALALGHPLSILAAFIAAPFTSLNPAIAAGWVAGYVELRVRKPRIKDFQNLMMLKKTSDYLRNRVMRVIIIVAFANIGSTIGTFIALPYLASLI